jgi:peptide/nickel transport system permease protein
MSAGPPKLVKLIAGWLTWAIACLAMPASEFGRSIGWELAISLVSSLVFAFGVSLALAMVSLAVGFVVHCVQSSFLGRVADAASDVVDSVPSVLWILSLVAVTGEPRRLVAAFAFLVVCAPAVCRAILGETRRQQNLPYVTAAVALGASRARVFFMHMIPNSYRVTVPLALATFSSALAIDCSIGILGVTNRTDMNLGVMLIRGYERFMVDPALLVATSVTFGLIAMTFVSVGNGVASRD